jgi:hypothetical protein
VRSLRECPSREARRATDRRQAWCLPDASPRALPRVGQRLKQADSLTTEEVVLSKAFLSGIAPPGLLLFLLT